MQIMDKSYLVIITLMDRLQVFDARTGQRTSELLAPAGVVRFTGVSSANNGIYFVSGLSSDKGHSHFIARVRITSDGKAGDLVPTRATGGASLGSIVGNTISAAPDGSQIIFTTSVMHQSYPPGPATYARLIPHSGAIEHLASVWSGQLSSLSWSAAGDRVAFLWGNGLAASREPNAGLDPANAPDFGVRTCEASAADLPASSTLVAPADAGLGHLACPVLSSDGTSVYAVASAQRLVRFNVGSDEPDILADDLALSGGGVVRLCRNPDDDVLILFERHQVSRIDLSTGTRTNLIAANASLIIASAAW